MALKQRDSDRWKRWRIAMRNPLTRVGFLVVGFFVVVAVFAPFIAPHPEHASGKVICMDYRLQPPSREYLFGTDNLGRDVLSRVIFGTRLSFGLALGIVLMTTAIGISLGMIAGYYGGWVDEVIMRGADILMSFPFILLAIVIVMATGGGPGMLIVGLAIPWWPSYARLMRGEVVQLREIQFVEAARVAGASDLRIIFSHILPNVLNIVITQSTFQIGRAILAVGGMGFLGVGIHPPLVEWGFMVAAGRGFMPFWWWISVFPGAAIFLLGFGANLFGDGIRDILDPRTVR